MPGQRMRRRVAAAFLLGFLAGVTLVTLSLAQRVERLELQRQRLLLELVELHGQWERLQSTLRSQRAPRVTSARATFEGDLNEAEQLGLARAIKPLLDEFVGKPVDRLDPGLVVNVFRDRTVELPDGTYRLRLTVVVISQRLEVHFLVERQPPSAGGS